MADDPGAWRDISVAFDAATPAWPGDTPFGCGWSWGLADGASVNVSKWVMSPHVGTHADAPLHVSRDGAGADRLPIEPFLGDAIVVDARDLPGSISLEALVERGARPGVRRLLLQTGSTTATGRFPLSWPAIAADAARTLVQAGLVLLGVDAPSVDDRESKTLAVHRTLFDGGAYILENLDLRGVASGKYQLLALPLKTGAVDAAPARAFLRSIG